jgi:hypothetical protein
MTDLPLHVMNKTIEEELELPEIGASGRNTPTMRALS